MGRTVNLCDLDTSMARNRLVTEEAHWDDYQIPRSQSDVSKMSNAIGDQFEDKTVTSELRRTFSNKKSNGTPMKMLIAQELSKDLESKRPPSVVAKLMGLDALPGHHTDPAVQRSQQNDCSPASLTQPPLRYWLQEGGFLDKKWVCESHQYPEKKEYKDVYEVSQQHPRRKPTRDKSLQKGRCNENQIEKKMALVRQKFIEAKRLATDERLRHSKEFQDALEVLNSNKDVFLKFLQEPNSLFSQHLSELSIPPPPKTKRITVLRPSNTMNSNRFYSPERKSDRQIKKQTFVDETKEGERKKLVRNPFLTNHNADNFSPPTRIVVLKPSPGNNHDNKAVSSSPSSSPRIQHNKDLCGMPLDCGAQESREVAKEITRQMRENSSSCDGDETFLSSAFSNCYMRDGSSFDKLENDFMVEGNLSDSEIMTPISRHSWDYSNRFGSPFSSSFSRATNSPESAVCREAKKRLSERWALMTSSGTNEEQRQKRRSSSTLGEMLVHSDRMKIERSSKGGNDLGLRVSSSRSFGGESDVSSRSSGGELDLGRKISRFSNVNKEGGPNSPRNMLRSRSVPSSSAARRTVVNVEVRESEVNQCHVLKEDMKGHLKYVKSSFKGKFSNFFFSRDRKSSEEKSVPYTIPGQKVESQSVIGGVPGILEQPFIVKSCNVVRKRVASKGFEGRLLLGLGEASRKMRTSVSNYMGSKRGTISCEAGLSQANRETPTNPIENQDQPSPISVLETPFKDVNTTQRSSGNVASDHHGTSADLHSLKPNLIDKSPPIGSVSRRLSWDGTCLQQATPNTVETSMFLQKAEEEDQEWFVVVQSLLSAAGLDKKVPPDAIITRWYSHESPLDPSLMDRCFGAKDYEDLKDYNHEAKQRQERSRRKLLFDSVNAAILDITGYGSDASPRPRTSGEVLEKQLLRLSVDHVWDHIKDWFSSEARCYSGENDDNNSLIVEMVARKEVVGWRWVELLRLEIDGIGKDIAGKMLEQLVEEVIVDFAGRL